MAVTHVLRELNEEIKNDSSKPKCEREIMYISHNIMGCCRLVVDAIRSNELLHKFSFLVLYTSRKLLLFMTALPHKTKFDSRIR